MALEYYMVFDHLHEFILHCCVEDEAMAWALGKSVLGHYPKNVQKRELSPYDSTNESNNIRAALGLLSDRSAGRRGYITLNIKATWEDAQNAAFVEWLTRQEKIDRLVV